jgi:hypothetical protein
MSQTVTRLAVVCLLWANAAAAADFDSEVAPILLKACVGCHSGLEPEGGFDLTTRDGWLTGGESGAALDPNAWELSRAYARVKSGEMPPKEPLAESDREALLRWMSGGATWGQRPLDLFQVTTAKRGGYDWWSLQPLRQPSIPTTDTAWTRNPIDRFVVAKLAVQGLTHSPAASRRVLIRRLTYDLLGLPPTPEEVADFEADDRPQAYERLVDRLLASPHYGVRWGRHWLDIVRFGESQGFERDKLRDNGWPYRDWVVNAFNADLPYDEFVRLQLAGDVQQEAGIEGVIATGFLVCGPWDEVGQKQQSAAMKAFVRQDELEDYTSVVGETFLGLTIHCARCHDHKFDPIRQSEYYQLAAALDGVHHGDRVVMSETDRRRKEKLGTQLEASATQLTELSQRARRRVLQARGQDAVAASPAAPIARWTFDGDARDSIGTLHGELHGNAKLVDGRLVVDGQSAFVVTAPLTKPLRAKTLEAWVRLDQLEQQGGGVISVEALDGSQFDSIVFGELETRRWMAGSEGFVRTKSFSGDAETAAAGEVVHIVIAYQANGVVRSYRNGTPYGASYQTDPPVTYAAGKAHIVFGLRHSPAGGNRLLAGAIEAAQLYDRALSAEEIAASAQAGPAGISEAELLAALTTEERAAWDAGVQRQVKLQQAYDAIQPQSVYAAAPAPPAVTHVLLRGNPASPANVVAPGGIPAVSGQPAEFGLPADADDARRRLRLAGWITSRDNPLFARVIVNRLWHYHFGAGLVSTPSDLGFNGGAPSHPELLDWLAGEFLRRGESLKDLHRLIVTSSTYRQSSQINLAAAERDAGNRWLWRMSPRRLEAETLRDATLVVAGQLNDELGGPGFREFETHVHNSQFYQLVDRDGPEFQRRTIYRTWIRSARSPLLDVFDCPDPSTKTPVRAVTVTPLQALSLMNNSFMLRQAGRFADRVRRDVGDAPTEQVYRVIDLAFGRSAMADEIESYAAFVRDHGLPEFCRVVLNSNEFLAVD